MQNKLKLQLCDSKTVDLKKYFLNETIFVKKIKLNVFSKSIETSAKELTLYATENDLLAVCFQGEEKLFLKRLEKLSWNNFKPEFKFSKLQFIEKDTELLLNVEQQIKQYFLGKRFHFEASLLLIGTLFQLKVWQALSQIPYGKTFSYKQLGAHIELKKGFQALGQANRANPLSLVIPCHRVISSSGQLSGYLGGTELKGYLLSLENTDVFRPFA